MQFRFSLVLATLACGVLFATGASRAADVPATFEPEFKACGTPVSAQEEERLKSGLRKYESIIAPLELRLQALGDPASAAERQSIEADIRPAQRELLRVLERLECKRLSLLKDSVVRGPAAPKVNFVEMRVNYATDRLRNPKQEKDASGSWNSYFSGDTDPDFKDFTFGKAVVTIPTQRQPGDMKVPGSRFVDQPDPARYFVLREIVESSRDAIFKELNTPEIGRAHV